ncbi:MAG: hypothetical protein E7256_10970 [Lachnospiraceae bacterium]|nr:hypothetical protein [Lachnospiraceae bacterium]
MLRLVLNDYKYGFNQGLINVARSGWMIYIYMLVGVPLMFHFDVTGIVTFYCSMIPMLLAMLLSRMYANVMNKTLLLCPLSKQERKDYFNTALGVRIAIPTALFLLLDGSLTILDIIPPVFFLLMTIVLVLYAVAVNIYCTPKAPTSRAISRSYDLPGTYEVWNGLMQVSGLLNMLSLVSAVTDKENPVTRGDEIVIGVLIAVELLLCIKIIVTYYKPVLWQTTSYEVQKRVEVMNAENTAKNRK